MRKLHLILLILVLSFSICFSSPATNITFYYGTGCPHCAATIDLLRIYGGIYNLSIEEKEVYGNMENNKELMELYSTFEMDPASDETGVPTVFIPPRTMVIGELPTERWREILSNCSIGACPEGVYNYRGLIKKPNFNDSGTGQTNKTTEDDSAQKLTIPVLIGAALVDSINPCTIAVMVMLLGMIMLSGGKQQALLAGLVFSFTIFVMYLLMGLGIFHAIASSGLTNLFFIIVTIAAFLLSAMEIKAYFSYKPGFGSVEMPMFLRPYAKKATTGATSMQGVVIAAVLCSLFLLPCSSGPYLMVLGMLAKEVSAETLSYLVVYNIIFIMPMLLITIAIYLGKTTAEKMGEAKERYIREIHLISGIIMFALFILMLNEVFHFF